MGLVVLVRILFLECARRNSALKCTLLTFALGWRVTEACHCGMFDGCRFVDLLEGAKVMKREWIDYGNIMENEYIRML